MVDARRHQDRESTILSAHEPISECPSLAVGLYVRAGLVPCVDGGYARSVVSGSDASLDPSLGLPRLSHEFSSLT